MGLFFNKEVAKNSSNSYLDDQKAVFDTKGSVQKNTIDNSYDEYIYKPKDYSNVPKYKASDEKKVDIVVDKNDFGYEELNPGITTIDIPKKNIHEDLMELVNNEYIDEKSEENSTSIYDEKISNELNQNEEIEIIDIDDSSVLKQNIEHKIDNTNKLSIFGNSDEPIEAKVHEINPEDLKSKPPVEVPVVEQKVEIKLNAEGKKICPNCGAPLASTADTCFLCGKKV